MDLLAAYKQILFFPHLEVPAQDKQLEKQIEPYIWVALDRKKEEKEPDGGIIGRHGKLGAVAVGLGAGNYAYDSPVHVSLYGEFKGISDMHLNCFLTSVQRWIWWAQRSRLGTDRVGSRRYVIQRRLDLGEGFNQLQDDFATDVEVRLSPNRTALSN